MTHHYAIAVSWVLSLALGISTQLVAQVPSDTLHRDSAATVLPTLAPLDL